jgi:transcriptional regulator with XRE-family HTH domain
MDNLFWTRVQDLLKTHGITQVEFAGLVGIPYNTFRGWIYKNRQPDVISACVMASILGVEVEYLIRGRRRPKNRLKIPMPEEQESNTGKAKILKFKSDTDTKKRK